MIPDPLPFGYNPQQKGLHNCRTWANKHYDACLKVANCNAPMPSGGGAGIVTVGGGPYWWGIIAGIRMLRDTGSKIPVQIWYRDGIEKVYPEQLDEFTTLHPINPSKYRVCGGWEAKYIALTETTLDRVLFLDGDAYCVANPDMLLGKLCSILKLGFWEDFAHQLATIKWPWAWPAGDNGCNKPIQGGQLVIDRAAVWPTLMVANWLCQHRDFYYPEAVPQTSWHLYGDQDALRVACAVTGIKPTSLGQAQWGDVAFICNVGGAPKIVHRCQGKMFIPSDIPGRKWAYRYGKFSEKLPGEIAMHNHFADVTKGMYGSEAFENHYRKNIWSGGSGAGSSNEESTPYIAILKRVQATMSYKSVVDIGCGDGLIARRLSLLFPDYRGFDISPMALTLFKKHSPGLSAELLDCYADFDKLPAADVLLVHDVLMHWPNDMVIDWLEKVANCNRWKMVILSHDVHQQSENCHLGGYRALDPNKAPMNKFKLEPLGNYLHKGAFVLCQN